MADPIDELQGADLPAGINKSEYRRTNKTHCPLFKRSPECCFMDLLLIIIVEKQSKVNSIGNQWTRYFINTKTILNRNLGVILAYWKDGIYLHNQPAYWERVKQSG